MMILCLMCVFFVFCFRVYLYINDENKWNFEERERVSDGEIVIK